MAVAESGYCFYFPEKFKWCEMTCEELSLIRLRMLFSNPVCHGGSVVQWVGLGDQGSGPFCLTNLCGLSKSFRSHCVTMWGWGSVISHVRSALTLRQCTGPGCVCFSEGRRVCFGALTRPTASGQTSGDTDATGLLRQSPLSS